MKIFDIIGTTESGEKITGQHFNVKVQIISKGQIR